VARDYAARTKPNCSHADNPLQDLSGWSTNVTASSVLWGVLSAVTARGCIKNR